MSIRVPILVLGCCAFLLTALVLADMPISVAPHEGVVLLRNGRVLTGKITRDGQRYFVALPIGEIHVKAAEVDCVCGSLNECYRHKRSRAIPGHANDHLDLAAWCITNGLYDQATQELSDASRIGPQHPKIALLARRLEALRRAPPQPSGQPATARVGPKPDDRLDTVFEELPSGVVETFTASIQPMLQNHCSTAGCHGSTSSSSFRLLRMPRGRSITQRFTQRNLNSVLQTIDRADPAKSPLLMKPIKPHGTASKAIFQTRDAGQYRQLVAWVYRVSNNTAPPTPKGPQSLPRTPAVGPMQPAVTEAADETASQPPIRRIDGLGQGLGEQHGAQSGAFVSRDPFDPETFNRRHFPKRARRTEPVQSRPRPPRVGGAPRGK